MSYLEYQGIHTATEQTVLEFVDAPSNAHRNSYYAQTLDALELPASAEYIPAGVDRKVNACQYPAIPPQIARHLARQQYENIQRLHRRFANRYTAGWLRYAQEVLDA
jgi:hypothetical protein